MGSRWKALAVDQRQRYVDLASTDKERYRLEMKEHRDKQVRDSSLGQAYLKRAAAAAFEVPFMAETVVNGVATDPPTYANAQPSPSNDMEIVLMKQEIQSLLQTQQELNKTIQRNSQKSRLPIPLCPQEHDSSPLAITTTFPPIDVSRSSLDEIPCEKAYGGMALQPTMLPVAWDIISFFPNIEAAAIGASSKYSKGNGMLKDDCPATSDVNLFVPDRISDNSSTSTIPPASSTWQDILMVLQQQIWQQDIHQFQKEEFQQNQDRQRAEQQWQSLQVQQIQQEQETTRMWEELQASIQYSLFLQQSHTRAIHQMQQLHLPSIPIPLPPGLACSPSSAFGGNVGISGMIASLQQQARLTNASYASSSEAIAILSQLPAEMPLPPSSSSSPP